MELNEFNQLISDLHQQVSQGNVQAMRWLGDMFYQGVSGKEQNVVAAFPYWKMAADYGDDDIAGKVGICLFSGDGCIKDVTLGKVNPLVKTNFG